MKADGLKGNTKKFEMSRYIDLDLYHSVERSHPHYVEMVTEMARLVKIHQKGLKRDIDLLELGAGTGLFTQDLVKLQHVNIDALEIDSDCVKILRRHLGRRARYIQGDAVTFCRKGHYDVLASTFAHDHIHYNRRKRFAANIRNNLKRGGIYIMGGEILPHFRSESERNEALYAYHGYIVNKAIREGHYMLAQIEINALKSGLEMIGDFKRHEKMFEAEMLGAEFRLVEKIKLGPTHLRKVGGVFTYVFKAV